MIISKKRMKMWGRLKKEKKKREKKERKQERERVRKKPNKSKKERKRKRERENMYKTNEMEGKENIIKKIYNIIKKNKKN